MSDTQHMKAVIEAAIHDIDNRILPNVKRITTKEIVGVLASTMDAIIKELHGTNMTTLVFQSLQLQTSIIYTLQDETSGIEIKDPVKFYTICMETHKKSLYSILDTLNDTNIVCKSCPHKDTCELSSTVDDTEDASWINPESVH